MRVGELTVLRMAFYSLLTESVIPVMRDIATPGCLLRHGGSANLSPYSRNASGSGKRQEITTPALPPLLTRNASGSERRRRRYSCEPGLARTFKEACFAIVDSSQTYSLIGTPSNIIWFIFFRDDYDMRGRLRKFI